MKKYNTEESIKGQAKYCKDNAAPHFAPTNGRCFRCKANIYDEQKRSFGDREWSTGIDVDTASNRLVTGCPHCNRSYCD